MSHRDTQLNEINRVPLSIYTRHVTSDTAPVHLYTFGVSFLSFGQF